MKNNIMNGKKKNKLFFKPKRKEEKISKVECME